LTQYAEAFEMQVARMRPFNHAGPGQADEYVLSSLAKQVAEATWGVAECDWRLYFAFAQNNPTNGHDMG
jgi:GDP-D-mannose dehydratase